MIINQPDDYQVKDNVLMYCGSYVKNNLKPEEIPIVEDLNNYQISKIDLNPKNDNFIRTGGYGHTSEEMETLIKLLIFAERIASSFNGYISHVRLDKLCNAMEHVDLNLNLDMEIFIKKIQRLEGIPDKFNDYIDYKKLLRAYQNLLDSHSNRIYTGYELFRKDNPNYRLARFIIYQQDYENFQYEIEKIGLDF